jgi:hypothetical protein
VEPTSIWLPRTAGATAKLDDSRAHGIGSPGLALRDAVWLVRIDPNAHYRRGGGMDDRYRPIYENVYRARTDPSEALAVWEAFRPDEARDVGTFVRTAIEASERDGDERTRRLREDAKAFLAVNFEDLIIYPLTAEGDIDGDRLQSDVTKDIQMLVSEASSRVHPNSPDREISARHVVDALSSNWSRLAVAHHGVWE